MAPCKSWQAPLRLSSVQRPGGPMASKAQVLQTKLQENNNQSILNIDLGVDIAFCLDRHYIYIYIRLACLSWIRSGDAIQNALTKSRFIHILLLEVYTSIRKFVRNTCAKCLFLMHICSAIMDMGPGPRTKTQKLLGPGPGGPQLLSLGPWSQAHIHHG